MLHSGRYEGTYKNLSAQSNFLYYIGACSKFGTKLIVSVPINLRSSFNSFHNIYTPQILIEEFSEKGWALTRAAFSPFRDQNIKTSLELRKLYDLALLSQVEFLCTKEGANFSWVIGFFEFEYRVLES